MKKREKIKRRVSEWIREVSSASRSAGWQKKKRAFRKKKREVSSTGRSAGWQKKTRFPEEEVEGLMRWSIRRIAEKTRFPEGLYAKVEIWNDIGKHRKINER